MKRVKSLLLTVLLAVAAIPGVAAPLSYFLPGVALDASVPEPASVLGMEIGDWHVRHDQLVAYLEELADSSGRVELERIGRTHELRPLLLLTISSPANLARRNELRAQHLAWALSDEGAPDSSEGLPLIVNMGYGVHGDESSASNAALVVAYYLAAAQSEEVTRLLENTVILLDPCLNPDGFARFAQWANMHRGKIPVADAETREHNAVWPGGRTNHYWFDLNRDWLPGQHPESRARLEKFHQWLPNIVTDFHEMGSDATYFFQPGVPARRNPLTPEKNEELTRRIAGYHARALDEIGSLYFKEEKFDDFYYGKGSSYADAFGSVGILFEQASSRGHLRESVNGDFDFAFTIRNQVRTSLSTFAAAADMRRELLDYQREFFEFSRAFAEADPVQGWVFGSAGDRSATWHVADMLGRHGIEFHELAAPLPGRDYEPGSSYIVPARQPRYRMVKALFERRTAFEDSVFYDISAWTLPLAAGVTWEELDEVPGGVAGGRVESLAFPSGTAPAVPAPYAYAFESADYYAPRLLGALLRAGVRCKVATASFEAVAAEGNVRLGRGTLLVPVGIQDKVTPERLHGLVRDNVASTGCRVHAIRSGGAVDGIDLGSSRMVALEAPRPLLLAGEGVDAYEAGEIWHLLDHRFSVPLAIVEPVALRGLDLRPYTHLLLASGGYAGIGKEGVDAIRQWIEQGGVLVAINSAAQWAAKNGLGSFTFGETEEEKKRADADKAETGKAAEAAEAAQAADGTGVSGPARQAGHAERTVQRLPYANFPDDRDSRRTSGAIFSGSIDGTHPLGFGFPSGEIALFRNSNLVMHVSRDPYATPVVYQAAPRLAGYVHPEVEAKISGSAAVIAEKRGKGAVIAFADNPNFRAFWFGTNRLFLNALFFGSTLVKTGDASAAAAIPAGDGHNH